MYRNLTIHCKQMSSTVVVLLFLSSLIVLCHGYVFCNHGFIRPRSASSSSIVTPSSSSLSRSSTSLSQFASDKKGALTKPPLELCDENMSIVMEEVKEELGTIFGYDRGSRDVGITGKIACNNGIIILT